ncbi:MAG: hypothetical protein R6V49_07560 [Bacteroidales bacterium]
MKKIAVILLLLTLIAPFYGTWSWLEVQKKKVKRTIKWRIIEGIDKEELVLLSFSHPEAKSSLRWIHSREFEYQGEMYDIVEVIEDADSIHYRCWWDYEETTLNRELRKIVASVFGNSDQTKEKMQRLNLFCSTLFCEELPSFHLTAFMQKNKLLSHHHQAYRPPAMEVQKPPPVCSLHQDFL